MWFGQYRTSHSLSLDTHMFKWNNVENSSGGRQSSVRVTTLTY